MTALHGDATGEIADGKFFCRKHVPRRSETPIEPIHADMVTAAALHCCVCGSLIETKVEGLDG